MPPMCHLHQLSPAAPTACCQVLAIILLKTQALTPHRVQLYSSLDAWALLQRRWHTVQSTRKEMVGLAATLRLGHTSEPPNARLVFVPTLQGCCRAPSTKQAGLSRQQLRQKLKGYKRECLLQYNHHPQLRVTFHFLII